ncbi:MAG: OmpA family protein [Acidobacteria bacterium]|nr:OmpA family protein [Acidobacteriota bacterium]
MLAARHVLIVALVFALRAGSVVAQSNRPYSAPNRAQQQELEQNLQDVRFEFDHYDLSPQGRQALESDANWLKANPNVYVVIRGEADERGSVVYNLALSQKRATVTRNALIEAGVPAVRLVFATGWGKLYPACMQSDETCWSRNRRAHFTRW